MFDQLTWACHICHEERPDALIGVYKKPLIFDGVVMGEQNIRYCLDKPECLDGAMQFSFVREPGDGQTD